MAEPEALDDPEQLELRLLARLTLYRKAPPERALFRELIDVALGDQQRFTHGGYEIAASTIHHVALVLYFRSNAAGIIIEFSVRTLARDARLGERAVRAALGLLCEWRVIRSTRARGRRRPAEHRFNVGGLDWSAIRSRFAEHLADNAQRRLHLVGAQPPHNRSTSAREPSESGRTDRTESGRTDLTRRPESGRTDRTQGLGTYGRATEKKIPPNPPFGGTKGSQLEDHHQTPTPCEYCGGLGMVQHHCERHEPCGNVPCSAPGSGIGHAGSFMAVCACRKGSRLARHPGAQAGERRYEDCNMTRHPPDAESLLRTLRAKLDDWTGAGEMTAGERQQLEAAIEAGSLHVVIDGVPAKLPEGLQVGVDVDGRVEWVSLREAAA